MEQIQTPIPGVRQAQNGDDLVPNERLRQLSPTHKIGPRRDTNNS